MSDTSVVGTPDIIFDGIRFDIGSTYLPIYLQQIMFQNAIFHARDSAKCLQHHLILFFCALSMIKDGEVFGSSTVIFCVICNIFCAFDLGNLTPIVGAIWPPRWTIHDIKFKRFMSISIYSTILCGIGGLLLVVCFTEWLMSHLNCCFYCCWSWNTCSRCTCLKFIQQAWITWKRKFWFMNFLAPFLQMSAHLQILP